MANSGLGEQSRPKTDALARSPSTKGSALAPLDAVFEIVRSRAHGAVQAIGRLRLANLLGREWSRERDLVLAMIAARVLDPQSKSATARRWDHSTRGAWFGVADADENELYAALDWLLARQDAIEQRLARRHLREGARVLYDLSSTMTARIGSARNTCRRQNAPPDEATSTSTRHPSSLPRRI